MSEIKKTRGWKITAFIFIFIFILETMFFIYLYSAGNEIANNEIKCSTNICSNIEDANSYQYYPSEKMCYCFKGEDIIKEVYLG